MSKKSAARRWGTMEPRERIWRFGRALGPWVDPKSRRPLVLIAAIAMTVFLAPLGLDIAKALFFALPQWFRWSLGQGAVVAILVIGLRRLLNVRPTDAWPAASLSDESGPLLSGWMRWFGRSGWQWPRGATTATEGSGNDAPTQSACVAWERWVPWMLRLAVVSLTLPILENPDGFGFADWDFMLDKFEALRRTILEWGQFPWWNPWCRGGFPLAAEPSIGSISIATPFILWLGTTVGIRISAILCILIAVEGSYRLAKLWTREPWSAAAVALIYGLNGGVAVNTAWGYVIAMSYCSLPWLAFHAFRIGERAIDGLGLGFWMAFLVLNGINYLSLYAVVLTAVIWLRALRVQPPDSRTRLARHTFFAFGLFLLFCGWRLVTAVLVVHDDARGRPSFWDESPLAIVHYLLARPSPGWPNEVPIRNLATYIELTAYVGPAVFLLALASLRFGWRWWHTLALVGFWLAIGSTRWYHASRWASDWPVFASTHVVPRWRFVAILGVGLAVGDLLARWRRSGRRVTRIAAVLVVVAIAADYVGLAHQQLPLAFSLRPEARLIPGPSVPDIVTIRSGLGYPCTQRGYGLVEGYEPMLSGYFRNAPSLRRARGDLDYLGEAWTEDGPVRPVSWSPNRIVFRVEPRQEVHINQNPGSWWLVNGRPAFPDLRCAEAMVPFSVRADAEGRLDLRIRPKGLGLGLGLHLVGVAVLVSAWWWRPRLGAGGGMANSARTSFSGVEA